MIVIDESNEERLLICDAILSFESLLICDANVLICDVISDADVLKNETCKRDSYIMELTKGTVNI